jgi:hypothetical protein
MNETKQEGANVGGQKEQRRKVKISRSICRGIHLGRFTTL